MAEPIQPDKQLTPQAEQLLQTLIIEMVHEVRNPIFSNIGFSQLLLEEKVGPLNEKQRDFITHIHRTNRYLSKIFNQFSDLYRLIFGLLHLRLEEVDLGQLLDKAISANRTEWFDWENMTLKPKIESSIPDDLPNIGVDPTRIQQAVSGILALASSATFHREDGIITFTVNRDDNWIRLNVKVIGEESLYFYNIPDNPTLFFSRSIIEMHGGQLTVNVQEEQKRLEISFTLPIEPQVK